MNIVILGRGAWGRAIAGVVERLGNQPVLIGHADEAWPDVKADYVLIALPVQHVRETLARFRAPGVPVLSMSKGLEITTGERVSEIITEAWDEPRVAALSGPTFASEIAAGLPAICTIAAEDEKLARDFQAVLHQPSFRIYTSGDLVGVELGGALKNIYAIAGGACHGLNLGQNALAGLLTRCLAEMTRIGVDAGARAETFAGLSGIGDLMLTATSATSRNFRFGAMLAQGLKADEILPQLGGVCEGMPTTRSVFLNSAIPADSKPIITHLHAVLYEGMPIDKAVKGLLTRAARDE
ncbi:MAG TPA: NAD(P)H-dependent glycerol-3-phosphate dehydrogenase [Candidatus Methylacidiphilales bacterium]|jgi:glycerol-3-phosphate dehydrogenase (NAD(P)+)|nr:NAD(P)H-dependent glycerol-3-phosphate dehydrogenase [Candidatus Methylacidiphilales bacterium]